MPNPEQNPEQHPKPKFQLAYPPFETFRGFVESLHKTALPDKINKGLMSTYSGGMQSHLMIALRFLGLIQGPDSRATPKMQELVAAVGDKEKWSAALAKVIESAYQPVVHGLNLATITSKDLDEAFKTVSGLEGTMLDRAERFYLKARADAKMPVSPHLTKRKPRTVVKRPSDKGNGKTLTTRKPNEEEPPDGTIRFPIYFKNKPQGSLIVPAELAGADVKVIELMIPMLRAYAGDGTE